MSLYKKGKELVSRKAEGGLTRTKSHNRKSAKWYEKERHEFPGSSTATGNMKAVHSNIYYKVSYNVIMDGVTTHDTHFT